jgi:DNA-binding NarL/FixJ family response regulator
MGISNKTFSSRKAINVVLFTKYKLISSHLSLLLEDKSEIKIQNIASDSDELLRILPEKKPDVVLFCLMEDEIDKIEVIPQIFEVSPNTKVLVLSALNGKLDQTRVLKLGATGIVGAHQKEEVLIRAIRQVSEGEVCLSKRLISQLLGNGGEESHEKNGSNGDSKYSNQNLSNQLTTRELEVVTVMARGLTNKEISKQLFISEATVRHHLSSIYGKLQVDDRLNLVIYAYQHQLVKNGEQLALK